VGEVALLENKKIEMHGCRRWSCCVSPVLDLWVGVAASGRWWVGEEREDGDGKRDLGRFSVKTKGEGIHGKFHFECQEVRPSLSIPSQ
jgi:hypothetical protein